MSAPPDDPMSRFRRLAAFAAGNLNMRALTHRWATHDLMPPDELPYIGQYHALAQGLWVACGFKQARHATSGSGGRAHAQSRCHACHAA